MVVARILGVKGPEEMGEVEVELLSLLFSRRVKTRVDVCSRERHKGESTDPVLRPIELLRSQSSPRVRSERLFDWPAGNPAIVSLSDVRENARHGELHLSPGDDDGIDNTVAGRCDATRVVSKLAKLRPENGAQASPRDRGSEGSKV